MSKRNIAMPSRWFSRAATLLSTSLVLTFIASAQSGSVRPRRVAPGSTESKLEDGSPSVASTTNGTSTESRNAPSNGANATATTDNTSHAYTLLQQKQYAEAAKEAKQIAAKNPEDSEAWKIAGFAEYSLKQYADAASDLQKALDLQRKAKAEDANTVDALANAFIFNNQFDQALPLLVIATTRKGATPDPEMLYSRGLAEYKTGKSEDAERSFNAAVKANPKNTAALFYLGEIALKRNDFDGAISALNRATTSDSRVAAAWQLLTQAYLRRAQAAGSGPKADADYLSAVRAAEGLTKVQSDEQSNMLYGRALLAAKQYPRAAVVLERVASNENASGATLYLLGFAYVNAKNYPKAISSLERAAAKTPEDVNIYRLLGYSYEVSKQYAKALTAYEKGVQLAPTDADLKESSERVRPFAK
jgi:tetratricopeptide (TPR) repeat protein